MTDKTKKSYSQIVYKGETESLASEATSSVILKKMKGFAEIHLGEQVNDVVVMCPAYFNDAQIQAIKDTGTIVGLSVLRIINESTAAALGTITMLVLHHSMQCLIDYI